MSDRIDTTISWKSRNDEGVREIAKKYLNKYLSLISTIFLQDIICGKSFFRSQKGDFWVFGGTFNNYAIGTLIAELKPFFHELFVEACMYRDSRIIGIEQHEQHKEVTIYQIRNKALYKEPVELEVDTFTDKRWFFGED